MTAAPHNSHAQSVPLTGHRPGRRPDEPRNNTVCFTVTTSEQKSIDALSMCIHMRRSAILTEVATRFMAAAAESSRSQSKRAALLEFLEECQEKIRSHQKLFDELTIKE